jgi:hypothetical protein
MNAQEFDPQRWDHWLVIVAFVALSSWIIWKVYLDS